MKKSEWDRRLPLDRRGVRILGAALLARTNDQIKDVTRRIEEGAPIHSALDKKGELKRTYYRSKDHRKLSRLVDERIGLEWRLEGLDVSNDDHDRARSIRAMDLRFRWDNLYNHRILLGYVTDDLPDWAQNWHPERPIIEQREGALIRALKEIFELEFKRLRGPDPDHVPYLSEPEQFQFHLAVWKLCEPQSGPGQPKGRRWADGLDNAAALAWSLRDDAKKKNKPISNEEAIRGALMEFSVVGSKEFADIAGKSSVIVSDAASPGGRMDGAKKAVRKRLKEIDDQEGDVD